MIPVTCQVTNVVEPSTVGFGFASFLLGLATSGNQEHTFSASTASSYYGLYVQDDWKVSQRLTINFGIRWDTDLPHTERYNRLSYFDPDAPSPLAGKVPGFPNLKGAMKFTTPDHRRQTPTDLNNWGPRFGFAYGTVAQTFRSRPARPRSGTGGRRTAARSGRRDGDILSK